MTVTAIFGLIYTISKDIPIINDWIEKFVAWYVANQIAKMKKENQDAIRLAIEQQDQRGIEHAIGSSEAGKQSDIPGTHLVDTLPGVDKPK